MDEKMKKMVVPLVIGLVVGALLGLFAADSGLLGEGYRFGSPAVPKTINANACSADSICETKKVMAEEGISAPMLISTQFGTTVPGKMQPGDIYAANNITAENGIWAGGHVNAAQFNSDGLQVGNGTIYSTAGNLVLTGKTNIVDVANGELHVGGAVTSKALAGNGNAYVCTDYSGEMYRSISPCTV